MHTPQDPLVAAAFSKMNLDQAGRHALLCVGPRCCTPDEGKATWETLKSLVRDLHIPALRSQVSCFRICRSGPWLVIYPEGVWYGSVTPERCERIVREHLVGGRPVAEWIAHTHPLPPA